MSTAEQAVRKRPRSCAMLGVDFPAWDLKLGSDSAQLATYSHASFFGVIARAAD